MIIFRDIILSLGIMLGFFQPQLDPVFEGRLFRDQEAVYISGNIADASNEQFLELVSSGIELRIQAEIRVNGEPSRLYYHGIRYSPVRDTYEVFLSESQGEHETEDLRAAEYLLFHFNRIYAASLNMLYTDRRNTVEIKYSMYIPGQSELDPMVLWNYHPIVQQYRFHSITEIPF
ncbi:MAG: hypothetical protein ACLFR1_06770 [Spirochaetia bacterium]